MSEFEDRGYIVTGGASGIGKAVVETLARNGARVAVLDRDPAGLASLAQESWATQRVVTTPCDVSQGSDVEHAVSEVASLLGPIDGLVNAAGIVVTSRFLDFSDESWDRTFRVNVLGTYLAIKHVQPILAARGGGRIVNVASIAGKIPNQYTAPYAASKAAVISVTRSAAAALAPHITVNAVCPGIIDTPMWVQLEAEYAAIGAPLNFRARAAEAPLGRPGTPHDVADVIVSLLSDSSRFVTGEDINVAGGMVMH